MAVVRFSEIKFYDLKHVQNIIVIALNYHNALLLLPKYGS